MPLESSTVLRSALASLGALLSFRGIELEIVVVGGAAMLLSGFSSRVTKDVDVLGAVVGSKLVRPELHLEEARSAIEQVARDLALPRDWLNPGPSSLLDFGPPPGLLGRATVETFGSLTVHIAERSDLIALKLYAAVDQGPASKHFEDLQRLEPTVAELREAANWCRTHDPSEGFASELNSLLRSMGAVNDD